MLGFFAIERLQMLTVAPARGLPPGPSSEVSFSGPAGDGEARGCVTSPPGPPLEAQLVQDGQLRLSLEPIKAQDDVVEPMAAGGLACAARAKRLPEGIRSTIAR